MSNTLFMSQRAYSLWTVGQACAHGLTAIRSPGLPFSGRHPFDPCNYYSITDHGGMEGWVGLVC